MFDVNTLSVLTEIRTSEHQRISLVRDDDGRKYIQRIIYDDKREIYKLLQKINHPSIPKIYHIGFDGNTTVIEEYFDAKPLSENLSLFTKKTAILITKRILSTLKVLHGCGIIHRDIKPDNILINDRLDIMLIDYDISRVYRPGFRKDTEQKGTFGYAPIEQYGLLPTDFKTDIYSFGVTLKNLLEEANIGGFLHKIADKCKKLDPEERYRSISDILKAIKLYRFAPVFSAISAILICAVIITLPILFKNSSGDDLPNEKIPDGQQDILPYPDAEISENDTVTLPVQTDTTEEQTDDGYDELVRFTQLDTNEFEAYAELENFEYTRLFSSGEIMDFIPFLQDISVGGKVLLGNNHEENVNFNASLDNGTFSIALSDKLGHSLTHDFSLDGFDFSISYPDDRRINAEIFCRDLDRDGVEEFIIGIGDCSTIIYNGTIYVNCNICVGYVIKYNQENGFILCDGEMISEGAKFMLSEDQPHVFLSANAINSGYISGYRLDGNKISDFF